MARRILLVTLSLLACSALSALAAQDSATPPAQPGPFHAPSTPAELALDQVAKLTKADENLVDYVLKKPGYNKAKAAEYSDLFTANLLKAWADAEVERVKQDCGGKYTEGDICGIDYDPIVCAQDFPDHYLYRTDRQTPTEAVISSIWADSDEKQTVTYRLVFRDQRWQLDGVRCPEADGFNMQ